jgi:hypothetical protein
MIKDTASLGREMQHNILKQQSPEQKLDSLEKESRSILELNPKYGLLYIVESYRRKHRDDTQRTS